MTKILTTFAIPYPCDLQIPKVLTTFATDYSCGIQIQPAEVTSSVTPAMPPVQQCRMS